MEMRFKRDSSKENRRTTGLQMKKVETKKPEPVPDLTELMNDWFFGSINREVKTDEPVGGGVLDLTMDYNEQEEEVSPKFSPRNSTNSRLTQEWLQEAKLMVASSPGRCDSPTRLIGSPRFAPTRASELDRRDPMSRSARRHRAVESFSEEILSKSAKHSRNRSETFESQPSPDEPPSTAHHWFSKPSRPLNPLSSNLKQHKRHDSSEEDQPDQSSLAKPPRLPIRKSRFRDAATATEPAPLQSWRTFKAPPKTDNQLLLSPPKNLTESVHRRSTSSSTCLLSENQVLSPPKNYVESAHRRSISSSTCSLDKISSKPDFIERLKESSGDSTRDLNVFLKEHRSKIRRISSLDSTTKAKIVLSGSSNSTSSMVAAICYAWLLEKRTKENKEEELGYGTFVVPVMNGKRSRMWKQRQAAWLFHHVGIDATSLLFSDEVDLEGLMMSMQLVLIVVGQDVLKINDEVGSQCTMLTDNYCEDAYDMLQIPILKKLLLAGILLDTQNLSLSTRFFMNRDTEAVQLLLVGSASNYRNNLFDQLMQDQCDDSFLEALHYNYGKPPNNGIDGEKGAPMEHSASARKSASTARQGTNTQNSVKKPNDTKEAPKSGKPKAISAPAPATPTRAPEPTPRAKGKFSIAKFFGFGR